MPLTYELQAFQDSSSEMGLYYDHIVLLFRGSTVWSCRKGSRLRGETCSARLLLLAHLGDSSLPGGLVLLLLLLKGKVLHCTHQSKAKIQIKTSASITLPYGTALFHRPTIKLKMGKGCAIGFVRRTSSSSSLFCFLGALSGLALPP